MSCIADFLEKANFLSSLTPLIMIDIGFVMAVLFFRKRPIFSVLITILSASALAVISVFFNVYLSISMTFVAYLFASMTLSKIFVKLPVKTADSFRLMNLIFGISIGFLSILAKGVSPETLLYALNVSSYAYVLYILKSPSIVPSIFLSLSFAPFVFSHLKFSTFSSALLILSLIAILIINFNEISRSNMSRNVLMTAHRFVSLYVVVGLALVIFDLSFDVVEPLFFKMENMIKSEVESLITTSHQFHEEYGMDYAEAIGKSPVPWNTEYVLISENGKSIEIGDPKKACITVFKDFGNVKIKLGVSIPPLKTIFSIIRVVFLDIMALSLIFILVHRSLYLRWTKLLDEEVKAKTKEVVVANEELVALNEELVSMNEDMERMYSNLSELNEKMVSLLTFLKEISIEDDLKTTFSNLFEHMLNMFRAKLRGLKLIDTSKGKEIVSVGSGGYPIARRYESIVLEVYFEEVVELSDEDERLFDIVASISYFVVQARLGYEKIERSERASTKVLELLDLVVKSSSKEEIERVLLKKILDVFEDAVVVGISWKENMSDDTLAVKFIKKGFDHPRVEVLRGRGIMRIALETGKEYLTQDAKNDPNFLIVDDRSNSAFAVPMRSSDGNTIGVMIVERSEKEAFSEDDLKLFRIFARITAVATQKVEYLTTLKKTFIQTVEALAMAIELKDPYTHGHSRRVADYSVAIAKELKLPDETIERIELAALLHDIGKIGIRGYILNKPTRLTQEEYEEIKKHPVLGEELVSRVSALRDIAKIIRHHHENWGGGGYPDGLKDGEIPLESRIIAIADAFDSMTSDRPYRKALSLEVALDIISKNDRLQWDPNIVPIAVKVLKRVYEEVRGKYVA